MLKWIAKLFASPNTWMPIESAPDDKEVLIGRWIDGAFKWGRSMRYYDRGNEMAGDPACGWVWSIDDCNESVAEDPTCWMPLPEDPPAPLHIPKPADWPRPPPIQPVQQAPRVPLEPRDIKMFITRYECRGYPGECEYNGACMYDCAER